jgi:hypothetical protein
MTGVIIRDFPAPPPRGPVSPDTRLAFWINAYNELVAEGLRVLGIRETVWEVPDFFDRIQCRAGAGIFSANDIEHGVLRGNRANPLTGAAPFGPDDPRLAYAAPLDPRIHFAIHCGARSCPTARRYDGARLGAQLDASTRAFLGETVTLEGGTLVVTPIFRWFAEDFAQWPGGPTGFLAAHLEDGPVKRAVLDGGGASMTWRDYDWRLPAPAASAEGR